MSINEIYSKSFLVGGAVRDRLMGRKAHDCDWVVVNTTVEEMIAAGFSQVGAHFPVFLHPETGDEYALARVERKSGSGYTGFTVSTTGVTLAEDLQRRDLTINAIAMSDDGTYFDPYRGIDDLRNKVLRHVSDAFDEDPLRILRVARFAAKFPSFGIDPSTVEKCKTLGKSAEFAQISQERIGQELIKVLLCDQPSRFFYALDLMECLDVHFPEIAALKGQTQPEKWHPEGDAFVHTMEVLDRASEGTQNTVVRFCALVHDLGKGLTPKELLPSHFGHEQAGVPLTEAICDRMALGSAYKSFGMAATALHGLVHVQDKLNPKTFVKIYEQWGRNLAALLTVAEVAMYDAKGRGPYNALVPYDQKHWKEIFLDLSMIKASTVLPLEELQDGKFSPERIKAEIYKARVARVKEVRNNVQQET